MEKNSEIDAATDGPGRSMAATLEEIERATMRDYIGFGRGFWLPRLPLSVRLAVSIIVRESARAHAPCG